MNNKIKFQNPRFRQKLQEARGYRREYKKIPETKVGIFLARIGLNSTFAKILAVCVILLALYIIYAPNFLYIKSVEITGASNITEQDIQKTIQEYFKQTVFWPQKNILLLSKSRLADFLQAKNKKVSRVVKIEKDFPNKLLVKIEERVEKFLLQNQSGAYVVSNDGLIIRQLAPGEWGTATSQHASLLIFDLADKKNFYQNLPAYDTAYFYNLNEIQKNMESLGYSAQKIKAESFEQGSVSLILLKGYEIKFDINSELPKIFEQLKLLLKEVGEARITGVKYIDMRIKDRGYVCYKDAACAQEFAPVQATTTPEVIDQD